uniref:DUF4283 domain-containing protein n=1 Tax=Tanacetum cinerariifolium TaxID=118510 RepID=A0A6L2L388_TANCI|nr:hypothetical protein [Tanacetum cinerariifolium]
MCPEIMLCEMLSTFKDLRLPIDGGMSPDILFPDKIQQRVHVEVTSWIWRFTNLDKFQGRLPENLFPPKKRILVPLGKLVGILPEKLLSDKSNRERDLSPKTEANQAYWHCLPEKLFRDKSSNSKSKDSNSLGGIDPLSLLSERDIISIYFNSDLGLSEKRTIDAIFANHKDYLCKVDSHFGEFPYYPNIPFDQSPWEWGGRGVKEKSLNRNSMNTSSGIGVSMESDDTINKDTHVGVAPIVKEGVTSSVVDMMVEEEKICSLEDITNPELFPTLTMPVTNTAANAPGNSSYANITSKPSGKKVNVRTLFAPVGNGIDVVAYPVVVNNVMNTWGKYRLVRSMFSSFTGLFSFQFSSVDGLDAMLENGPWFIQNNPLILKNCHPDENLLKEDGRSSYARVMIELRADVELNDNIVVAMPKITKESQYTCNVHVEYEWKPPSSSGKKKKGLEPTIEVSNSNPFDVLNSVNNDGEFGKLSLLDDDGNPLVPTGMVKSDSEVEMDSYPDNDDYDPYDDDMYDNHDMSEHLQSICDDLDITIRGRKKK